MVVVRGKGACRLFSLSLEQRDHQLAFPRLQKKHTPAQITNTNSQLYSYAMHFEFVSGLLSMILD